MEYALLRSLRTLGPGLMWLTFVDLFLLLVRCEKAFFWDLDTSKLLLLGYIAGGIFGAITSVFHKERHAFRGVNEAILCALDEVVPGVATRGWKDVSPCFYKIVDNDKSLEQKSKGIFFNGLVVTSSFDAVWISLLAAVVGLGVVLTLGKWNFMLFATSLGVVAYLIWLISLRRHVELAKGQVAVIKKRFEVEFRDCVQERCGSIGSVLST